METKYELFYSSGGHGGPYPSIEEAEKAAKRLLCGNKKEHSIEVRLASDFRTVVRRLYQNPTDD